MKKKVLVAIFCYKIFIGNILCNENKDLNFVNIPIGTSISLGNELSVVDNGVFSLFTNPAMLGIMRSVSSFEYNRLFYYADTYYDLLGLCGTNVSEGIVSGVTIGRFSSGNIAVRDIEGVVTGENFEYSIMNANIGFATRWGKYFWVGFSGYGLWEKSNLDTRFFGSNVGLMYNTNIKNKLLRHIRIGGVVRGVGLNKNLVHSEGIMLKILNQEIYFGSESGFNNVDNQRLNLGINFILFSNATTSLLIRAGIGGFNNNLLKSYGTGFGLRYKDFILDYSFNTHSYLNTVSNIRLGLTFGEVSEKDYIVAIQKKEKEQIKAEKKKIINVAVTNFSGKNVVEKDSIIVSDFFRSELAKTKKYNVLEKENMEKILSEQKVDVIVSDTDNAVQVGRVLKVEQLIFGVVAKIKEKYYLTIHFVNIEFGRIVKSESVSVRDFSEFQKAVKEFVLQLKND